jgi:Kinesin motor domain
MEEIFRHIEHRANQQSTFMVRASYLQIYNETISDLLKTGEGRAGL